MQQFNIIYDHASAACQAAVGQTNTLWAYKLDLGVLNSTGNSKQHLKLSSLIMNKQL